MSQPKASHAGRLPRGRRFGRYEVLDLLGAGGMGEVYRARDTSLSREVALKILTGEATRDSARFRRFQTEAQASAALSHPNIVSVYDVGEEAGTPYIVSELVEGTTLAGALARGPFPTRRLLDLAVGISEGLAAAHGQGIVHRDLKPANVLLTAGGVPKIADFGLAKYFRPSSDSEGSHLSTLPDERTAEGTILGTVGYMSPEQAKGEPADFRSDQFSFGSILYEMATGKRAFQRSSLVQTLAAIVQEEPEQVGVLNPKTPAPLRWIVERCLAKEPKERYAATEDLARDLVSVRDHLSEATVLWEATAALGARPARRILVRWAGLATLGFLGVGLLIGRLISPARSAAIPSFQRLTFRRGEVHGARFSPDGQTIVYSATLAGKPSDLYSMRPTSTGFRALGLPGARLLSISSSGEMAVSLGWPQGAHRGAGMLARVSLEGGTPRQVLESVFLADWAPDGKNLAVLREAGSRWRLEFPIGKALEESERPRLESLRVSPDGKSVASIRLERPNGKFSIDIYDLAGRKRTVSTGWARAEGLAWRRDGKEIWFTATKSGLARELHAVTLSGEERLVARVPGILTLHDISSDGRLLLGNENIRREMRGLLPDQTDDQDLTWFDYSFPAGLSADGRMLLFSEGAKGSAEANTALWLRVADGSAPVRLGDGTAGSSLSPDGKWALALRAVPNGLNELQLLPTGAGEPRPIPMSGISPEWTTLFPDGKRFLFDGRASDGTVGSYIVQLSGGVPRPFPPKGMNPDAISPDGKWILCRDESGRFVLYPVAGGNPRLVPSRLELKAGQYTVNWSAEDDSVFVLQVGIPGRILRLDLQTGQTALWKEVAPSDLVGMRPVAPLLITPDGKFYVYTYLRALSDLYLAEGLK